MRRFIFISLLLLGIVSSSYSTGVPPVNNLIFKSVHHTLNTLEYDTYYFDGNAVDFFFDVCYGQTVVITVWATPNRYPRNLDSTISFRHVKLIDQFNNVTHVSSGSGKIRGNLYNNVAISGTFYLQDGTLLSLNYEGKVKRK